MSKVLIITDFPSKISTTFLYDSNCSSSVGKWSLYIYKNSVLNNPTPSAPDSKPLSRSSMFPILVITSMSFPSLVIAFLCLFSSSLNFSLSNSDFIFSYSEIVLSSGSIIQIPLNESIITVWESLTFSVISFIPTRQAIPKVCAIIDVWAVFPPKSIKKPTTWSLSIIDVS